MTAKPSLQEMIEFLRQEGQEYFETESPEGKMYQAIASYLSQQQSAERDHEGATIKFLDELEAHELIDSRDKWDVEMRLRKHFPSPSAKGEAVGVSEYVRLRDLAARVEKEKWEFGGKVWDDLTASLEDREAKSACARHNASLDRIKEGK